MNLSKYDPTRKTVGAMYCDAQKQDADPIENGDLTHELQKSLVDDLNETIKSNHFDDRPFYITIHESKDLQMKRMIKRRILVSLYRPYPEDDTIVFYTDPKLQMTKYCWCLPHWSEMDNILNNQEYFEHDLLADIYAWKTNNLKHFGFAEHDGKPFDTLKNRDKIIGKDAPRVVLTS